MLEAKLQIANDDLDRVKDWIEDAQEDLVPDMIASRPTLKTDTATTMFTLLGILRTQILQFQDLLLEKEANARRG